MKGARLWDLLPAVVAVVLVGTLLRGWAARLGYPYDLEWMEGAMVAEAWRLAHGQPLYTAPDAAWVPCLYPPGYPALLAFLASFLPLGAPLARAISVGSTLAAAGAIPYLLGHRYGRDGAVVGAICAGVFIGTWHHVGTFYDLARIDALYVGFLAWSVAFGLDRRRGAWAASAVLLVAAFLVKQNAAVVGLPLLAVIAARDGRGAAARFAAAAAIPALLCVAWLEWRTGGTFLDYAVRTPGAHPMKGFRAFPGTPWEVGLALPFAWMGVLAAAPRGRVWGWALGLGAVGGLLGMAKPTSSWPIGLAVQPGLPDPGQLGSFVGVGAWVAGAILAVAVAVRAFVARDEAAVERAALVSLGVVFVGVGTLMRAHHGGYLNVHAPMFWGLSAALGAAVVATRQAGMPAWAGAGVLTAQLGWSLAATNVKAEVPTDADRAAGDAIVARLREAEGPVLSPFAAYLPVLAGHAPSWHLIALWDVDGQLHPRSPFPDARADVQRGLATHAWPVIVDAEGRDALGYDVGRWYEVGERLSVSKGVFVPRTGWRASPRRLLVPRQDTRTEPK